jgi:hypothetical protein
MLLAAMAVGLASATAPVAGPRASSTRHYVCYRAPRAPVIDGRLDEAAWEAAAWTEKFVDIIGDSRPAPTLRTRAKLLWDDTYLYLAAELEEPDVWGTLTERDAVIFHDNDFEVFIDPDGDTHNYYELEINALGTVWDLFLVKPYRDGGPPINGWDIVGLQSAVAVHGTINDPMHPDTSWTVELALPWKALAEAAPETRRPRDGEQWRLNFSRVEWDVDARGGSYVKRVDATTGKPLPEHNWVWSPQGAVNMHMPERWGIVQFSDVRAGDGNAAFTPPRDEDLRWTLRDVYYAEASFFRQHGRYTDDLSDLDLGSEWRRPSRLTLQALHGQYEATARGADGVTVWHIRQDGRIWAER